MMALVPRMLYFFEGLEAACLMAQVVLPAAGRPTIIRIWRREGGQASSSSSGRMAGWSYSTVGTMSVLHTVSRGSISGLHSGSLLAVLGVLYGMLGVESRWLRARTALTTLYYLSTSPVLFFSHIPITPFHIFWLITCGAQC